MGQTIRDGDQDLMQRSIKIVTFWIAVFFAASLGMIFYGDLLMQLFTPVS